MIGNLKIWLHQFVRCTALAVAIFIFGQQAKSQVTDYEMKVLYIEKLSRYIAWPGTNLTEEASKPFVIAVIGRNPFRGTLEKHFKMRKIQNRKVEVRNISTIEEIAGCQLLFISASEKSRLRNILQFTTGKPVLTISDTDGFCEHGVYINLYINEEDQLKFEINETKIREAGFKVDLLLLEIARIINPMAKR
jgi:hypothetical protein